ncbi:hypothetical protein KAM333_33660 [Aeromonas caviae]|nr:hypothetical protein KAM333_33660 [Aeromonas caviae]GJA14539.1 hypothetical protein KAM335_17350 [Aeromonas caviae]GJA22795.1 hypothetical protein KAM337_13230 [Aeromonas caviae]GJB19373.1 hypothetical protein KAM364_12850 [Aeromonas caviae]
MTRGGDTQWQELLQRGVGLTVGVRQRHPVVVGKILGVFLDEVVAIGGKVCVTQGGSGEW